MNTFNNFSPLAFREKSMKATYKKWYAYGKEFALPFSTTELPPFQFTVANLPSFDPTTVEVFLVNEATGVRGATGIKIKVDAMDGHGSVLYVSPGSNVYAKSIEPGVYRAEFAIPGGETYVSTPICVTEGIETNTNFVKLEYWNDEKLAYPNGFVTTGTDNDFKFQMYIPTTFFKPKYEFEEEITKRAGYKFLELQTCNKVFGFNFLAPEYICDALRLVRLSDYIRFTHDGEYYNALNFEYNPDWQDNGYLAAIECQFETDTIIQKLPSFNRRDRESFYNALLADIETPILFSPDVVGLYYREYKQGEPTIKGKLIRELSPIDLIDENTTIAVDMGAGEARKFNLYRMLEGYISKNHEDVTEFLLSLRGGVNIGTPNASGEYPANVDRDGNAKLKNIQGGDAVLGNVDGAKSRFDSVETGFFTVNNTAATIDAMGNTDVNDLTARGDSMLRSDVYTGSKNGSPTGKITKEGQLQYLSAIIYEFLSSETFVPGFLGEGFKIWLENGNWNIECDNLTVRQTMNVFELLIQKIRSVNGAIVVSQSNGKVTAVEDTGTQYKITFGEEFPTFQEGDLIRCQSWSKNNLKFYWVEVKTAADGYVLCDKSEFNNVVPAVGDEVVQMGNTKNAERQALIYITAQESGKPYIEILNGVKTKSLTGTDRTRLGDLSNIVDPDFTGEAAVKGTGFYSTNAFLKGIFVLRNGKRVEDEIKIAKDAADKAAQDAANAAQSAQEAKDRLNKWADDGLISPPEKPALIDEGKRIRAEHLSILADASKYGVPATVYTQAYNDYLGQLQYHSAPTPENIVVLAGLAESQTTYYNQRNLILSAIADAAKAYVDEADKKLKEYLDTEITAIPGKIELAVRSLKIADTNLLFDSNHTLNANPYQLGAYKYDQNLIVGKTYNLTVCYKCADSDNVLAYNNPSFGWVARLPKAMEETVYSIQITPTNPDAAYFYFYKTPQQKTTETYVKWAVITDGSIGVANWIPSATERKLNIGGENLVLASKGFLYGYAVNYKYKISKAWGDLKGKTLTFSFDYEYSSLKLGGDNRIGMEKALLKDGTSQYYYVGAFKYFNSLSLKSDKGRFEHTIKVPDDIELSLDDDITAYISTGSGTTIKIGNFQIEIGDTPTGWKPAPGDSFTESKKYTDTQILAVDGKIELSVKTKVENLGIGANNLYSYTSSQLNPLREAPQQIERQISEHGFLLVGAQSGTSSIRIPNIIPPIPGKYTVSGWIRGTQGSNPGLTIDVCDSVDKFTLRATPDNQFKYFKHTFDVTNNTEAQSSTYNFVDIENISWAYIFIKDFKVESGEIATAWSPNEADSVYFSKEYTTQQIGIVEGKITSTVEKINTVDGRVTGLASRVEQTEKSITSVVGDIGVINSTTNRHISKRIDLRGWDNNKFFPLVISIPVYHKTRVEISRPLDAGYGKPSYGTHDGGFSMNLTFEMSGSGWGSLPAVTNIFDYTKAWTSAGAKIVVDLGQITETSTCRMGIRGGSMYDVTVDDTIDPNVINVYQTDYHGSYNTSFPVRTDGTEPVRTYGYYTEIKQTQESIALTANKVDDQGRRLSAAELTLSADHAKLGVVEGTANRANTAAGNAQNTANAANNLANTANNKADTVDGRVTATQNGLVETGINITSRKIVLKSDNVLFQNNAGQQTAALNANGRLTANVIEAGDVVANGFAAKRITTGNLTVTDGAVIAGMTISGNRLTGGNVDLTNGARIGSFQVSLNWLTGLNSAQMDLWAGANTGEGNNTLIQPGRIMINQKGDNDTALEIKGKGNTLIAGKYCSLNVDTFQVTANQVRIPGVFYACTILANGNVTSTWGSFNFHITRVGKNGTGRYIVEYSGYKGDVFPMVVPYDPSKWTSAVVELAGGNNFQYKMWDSSRVLVDCGAIIYFCGMPS